jgi:hypothetical protein
VVSKMLTYVYIGCVGPVENVYVNKKNTFLWIFQFFTFEFVVFLFVFCIIIF